MKISKQSLLSQGKQAIEDRKILESAHLEEMEIMPTWNLVGALRFLQNLCTEENKPIQDITPEQIINVVKNQPRFSFE